MTRQEIEDMIPALTFVFERFYAYTFTYFAPLPDGTSVYAHLGGSSSELYGRDLNASEQFELDDIFRIQVGKDYWAPGARKEENEG